MTEEQVRQLWERGHVLGMLQHLKVIGYKDDRAFRLFACYCAQSHNDEVLKHAIQWASLYAREEASAEGMARALEAATKVSLPQYGLVFGGDAAASARSTCLPDPWEAAFQSAANSANGSMVRWPYDVVNAKKLAEFFPIEAVLACGRNHER